MFLNKNSEEGDLSSTRNFLLDDNTLKILLGLNLVFKDQDGFWNAAR
jgi:hypothetical protein